MKIGYMLRDAFWSLFKKPATVQYLTKHGEGVPVTERYRGKMVYDRDACIGCLLCIRTCPSGAITVTDERKVMFRVDRCIFCGQCMETCPKDAIGFTSDFEIVALGREELVVR